MYSVEQFREDSGISRQEVDEVKEQLLAGMRRSELREARRACHVTQQQLAENINVSQKRISILESSSLEHIEIRTLERYLQGIGATLEVTASLPDGRQLKLV